MPLISDVLNLPRSVNRGDFVLRLSEGITDAHADGTLRDYVVTPQLAANFRDALAFIRSALESGSSKGAYLHGSFGSGKSHFMAVLYLLLRGNPKARALPELAEVVQAQDTWAEGRKFLLVPYHMIGAHSMESAILGQYVEFVRRLHPEAPTPGVYLSGPLFDDARNLRQTMGDQAFFDALNRGKGGGGGWGNIGAAWDAARFDAATVAPEDAEDRVRLVGDLTDTLFTAYAGIASGQGRGFVSLDRGLSVISHHARSLGYDAVILFLDELILWLASRAADSRFLSEEGQKLAKLVEAQDPSRPIPIVSFVARQRDIRDLVGEHSVGAHALAFNDVFRWWEARFHVITLEDRNLSAIVEKRVLAPVSPAARAQMDAAFTQATTRLRPDVRQALVSRSSDDEFRQVYPFSPALVQVLVAVSSMLQRERTALKVMLQLLVNQRDTLELGQLVAVGDLFDVIAEGDEAFNEQMRQYFDGARRLWATKLRPMLEAQHGVTEEELAKRPWADPVATAFRADARLLKTLLIAALVPNVDAVRSLDARRLGALNHGSLKAPIPGQEDSLIIGRLRNWAANVGEIHISDDRTNPTVSLQITGVDVDGILAQASAEDNPGNRLRKIRSLVFGLCGIQDRDELFLSHEVVWRGTKRRVEVRFSNVRDLPMDSLRARGTDWLLVVDFPFDEQGRTPADDRARVEAFRETEAPSNTIVWIPAFLSRASLNELKQLILIDHVLAGDRLVAYTAHLTQTERESARVLLENQRSQLNAKLRMVLEGAYGIAREVDGSIDTALEHPPADRFQSLDPTLKLQPPVGPTMAEAVRQLLDQALHHQFPAHPRFDLEGDIRPAMLKRVYAEVQRAIPEPRLFVEAPDTRRLMRQIAVPLSLGEMGEQHFVLKNAWTQHFDRKVAEHGGSLTVRRLRGWIDEPTPRGLPTDLANLVILTYAEQKNLRFLLHGGPATPTIDSLHDDLELREIDLPSPTEWTEARARASKILGLALLEQRTASNVAEAVRAIQESTKGLRVPATQLVDALKARVSQLGIGEERATRLRTARAALALVAAVDQAMPEQVIGKLAGTPIDGDPVALGTSLKTGDVVAGALRQASWTIIDPAMHLTDEARRDDAARLRADVEQAICADEYVTSLKPALEGAQTAAAALLARVPPPPRPDPDPKPEPGPKRIRRDGLAPKAARELLDKLTDKCDVLVTVEWTEPE
ncbi:hypothetical protein TBR22_A06200 [Luteitalea sp. TBR-22]|uniref:hypothetical protein n=1 Tax=Luteitalea sp. TBR-22 TaxID=2802971 RepID=UPI001AF4B863|nr:hypothetical protein [Luteitalea sp. TBR-22]BCS31419.1 hypothetical protein TBR22_A06200 [Luteitalea sp. TBR-22]